MADLRSSVHGASDGHNSTVGAEKEPLFLTVYEMAEALRVHKTVVYRMIETKQLPCIKIGRQMRIPYSVLKAFQNCSPQEPSSVPEKSTSVERHTLTAHG